MAKTSAYVLVTPARNEDRYIEATILSVVAQTVPPLKWVIVDDCSSDSTAAIAHKYAARHPWITVVSRRSASHRTFASKAEAFATGLAKVKDLDYAFVGNLDADIRIDPDYYDRILKVLEREPRIGIVGGRLYDVDRHGNRSTSNNSPDSVRGAVQFFRRQCYEDIGGYLALRGGGIDSAAEIMAREEGWRVRTCSVTAGEHLRPTGFNNRRNPLFSNYQRGFKDRALGYCGFFEVARCFARMMDRPYIMAGLLRLIGYCVSRLRGDISVLPSHTARYFRREQRTKLLCTARYHIPLFSTHPE